MSSFGVRVIRPVLKGNCVASSQNTASYLDTSRGYDSGHRRKDVYNCRTCYRLRCIRIGSVRPDLLDNNIVLTGDHRSPLRYILYITVGANCVRPQKPDTIIVSGSMRILAGCSQCTAKSRCNPADFEFRGHKRISAKWICQPVW